MSAIVETLVTILKKLGFINVQGLLNISGSETYSGAGSDSIIAPPPDNGEYRRWAGCFDTNNGMGVIYTPEGVPWVHTEYNMVHQAVADAGKFGITLRRGAFVPLSNDGGMMNGVLFMSPIGTTVIVGAVTYSGVCQPAAVQILWAAQELLDAGQVEEAAGLKKLAAQVEEGKLDPAEGIRQLATLNAARK
ncbi:MAG TPA: hypothetical protein VJB37_02235 [Patescibacteria group bacterium]|nr:hypothetical protein [Patescibacteria group bacterium]